MRLIGGLAAGLRRDHMATTVQKTKICVSAFAIK